jgi:hypothetical protein
LKKAKSYSRVRFDANVIKEGRKVFDKEVSKDENCAPRLHLTVEVDGAEWTHDSEDEFFADYRRSAGNAVYTRHYGSTGLSVQVIPRLCTVEPA